jgi:tetratricopeptide (TPR) repeat protein
VVDDGLRTKARRLRSAGAALVDRGRYEEALARFVEALGHEPADADAWSYVQFCRGRLGDRQGSLDAAEEMVRLRPAWSRGHYARAFSLGRLGRYEEAARAAQEAVRLAPDDPENWRCLAQQARLAGHAVQARAAADRACELSPTAVAAWVELGRCARSAGEATTAERALRRALELDPTEIDAHVEIVLLFDEQRRYADAGAHARLALSLDWSHDPAAMANLTSRLAESLAATGRIDEACELFRTAIAALPRHARLRSWHIDTLFDAGLREQAATVAREAVAALPDHADTWSSLARVLDKASTEALAAARTATELDPSSSYAWYLYARCLRGNDDLAAAVRALHRCAAAGPGSETEQSRVSDELCDLGDPAAALVYADRAVALSPYAARPHVRRSTALLALGRATEALAAARTATELAPDEPMRWAHRAEIAYLTGDADDARIAAERAIASLDAAGAAAPPNAAHHAAEARAYAAWACGDLPTANAAFTEAVDLFDGCCCARVGAALTRDPRPDRAELAALVGPPSDVNSARCIVLSCRLRARILT